MARRRFVAGHRVELSDVAAPRLLAAVEDQLAQERAAGHLDAGCPLADLAFLVVRVVESFVHVERIVGVVPDPDPAARALQFLLR